MNNVARNVLLHIADCRVTQDAGGAYLIQGFPPHYGAIWCDTIDRHIADGYAVVGRPSPSTGAAPVSLADLLGMR